MPTYTMAQALATEVQILNYLVSSATTSITGWTKTFSPPYRLAEFQLILEDHNILKLRFFYGKGAKKRYHSLKFLCLKPWTYNLKHNIFGQRF